MAEPEANKTFSLPWAPLLALLAAVAGLAALLPSRSVRPAAVGGDAATVGLHGVSARLWQDPIGVVREAYAKESATPRGRMGLGKLPTLRVGYEGLGRRGGQNPLVLVACEPGSPYAEDVERRVRDRVAVVYALAAEGYLPEQSTQLNYSVTGPGEDGLLPYESFLPLAPGQRRPVLVVWLADGTLGNNLLTQIASLVHGLSDEGETSPGDSPAAGRPTAGDDDDHHPAGAGDWPTPLPEVLVVGPSNSLQYRRMLEAAAVADPGRDRALRSTQIWSPKSTAAEDVVAAGIPWLEAGMQQVKRDNAGPREKRLPANGTALALTGRLRQGGGKFALTRTVCDDGQLAVALWNELDRRQVTREEPVAAIAELDSFFGRASTLAFLHAREPGKTVAAPLNLREAQEASPNVLTFSHLAGIDGALPKGALGAEDRAAKDGAAATKTGASPATQEPTEGLGQVDYLRRLADELARENRRLNVSPRGKSWKVPELRAVAVLGSDIYDKLQILRTLRPRLPGALFLTLGLDARFTHPDEWEETRNLLAVSNYPLGPEPGKPREAPPFRDSYQAAVYAAARIALADHPGEALLEHQGRPRLFEVGRSGPVELRLADDTRSEEKISWWSFGLCGVLALVLFALLWVGVGGHETRRWFERSGIAVPVAFGVSLVATALRYQFSGNFVGEEPFAFLEGISCWPGDFLRLAVLLLAVHFVMKILHLLKHSREELSKGLALTDPDARGMRAEGGRPWRRWWRDFWPQPEDYRNGPRDDPRSKVQVQKLWLRYQTWGVTSKRLGRASLLTALYFFWLMLWTGAANEPWPHLPMRGPAGLGSFIILMLAVVGSLFVTFLVVDATEVNWRWIRDLNSAATSWHFPHPPGMRKSFRFGRHRELLEPADCAEYLDIELIASRTDVVNDLVYYPCILLTLLIVARWGVTDNYPWPPALLTAFAVNAAWALYCAIRLPIEANHARANSLKRLRTRLFARQCAEAKGQKFSTSNVAALEGVIGQIEHMNRGAFVNIWEQPVLRALLVPSSSAGVWALLEFLPR